jgi:hypothetical protein
MIHLLLLQNFLGHGKELVKVHALLLAEVFLDLLLGLRLLCGQLELIDIDESILRFVGIEGILDLQHLILVDALGDVLLHWKISRK